MDKTESAKRAHLNRITLYTGKATLQCSGKKLVLLINEVGPIRLFREKYILTACYVISQRWKHYELQI